jgi:hypothetical protein
MTTETAGQFDKYQSGCEKNFQSWSCSRELKRPYGRGEREMSLSLIERALHSKTLANERPDPAPQ